MSNIPMPKEEKRNRIIFTILGLIVVVALIGITINYFASLKDQPASWKSHVDVPDNLSVSYDGASINGAEITFSTNGDKKGDNSLRLFEDPSCSHCAELARDISGDIQDKVSEGADLHINLMSFLDKNTGLDFSKNNIATLVTLANQGEAEAAWKYYHAMWENQASSKNNPDRSYFSEVAVSFGASNETAQKINTVSIKDIQHIDRTNQDLLEEKTGEVSTPVLFVNDEMNNDPANVDGWGF